jgi:hypothetical protein
VRDGLYSKLLSAAQKQMRKTICRENLYLNSLDSELFINPIVAGDETYLHHYEPETKRMSQISRAFVKNGNGHSSMIEAVFIELETKSQIFKRKA